MFANRGGLERGGNPHEARVNPPEDKELAKLSPEEKTTFSPPTKTLSQEFSANFLYFPMGRALPFSFSVTGPALLPHANQIRPSCLYKLDSLPWLFMLGNPFCCLAVSLLPKITECIVADPMGPNLHGIPAVHQVLYGGISFIPYDNTEW